MINKTTIYISLLMLLKSTVAFPQKRPLNGIEWKKIAVIKGEADRPSLGYAGVINGVSGDVLLTAGGANFPGKMPWEGGLKDYSDQIYVLEKKGAEYYWNENIRDKLPEAIAYCGNTTTPLGIVYAGGENEKGLSKKVYILKWRSGQDRIEIKRLPDLPVALTNLALTHIGKVVYAVGGDQANSSSASFLSLDLGSERLEWQTLADLPVPLANALVVPQKAKGTTNIYVIGGRAKTSTGISKLYNTVFIYNPATEEWSSGVRVSDGVKTLNFSAGAGVSFSRNLILVTGGDTGEIFHQIESYISRIAKTPDGAGRDSLVARKNELIISHPGFNRDVLVYNTLSNSWQKLGTLPFPAPVTTTAAKWGKNIVLSNGEIKPGVRTPDVLMGHVK